MRSLKASRRGQRGVTLIEVMAASVVMLIGVLGLLSAHITAATQNFSAARHARAVAIAEDVTAAVARWQYNDARIANSNTANDASVIESGRMYAAPVAADFDTDLNAAAVGAAPVLSNASLDFNTDGANDPDFQRFLTVAPMMDAAGNVIGRQVGVVVAWQDGAAWRQYVRFTAKYDPSLNLATIPGI